MSNELAGRNALITGAGSGLGAETTRLLAAAGVNLAATDVDLEKAQSVARSTGDCPGQVLPLHLDVRDDDSAQRAIEEAQERLGPIDILINNAGTDKTVPFDELTVAEWDRVMGVNLRGSFLMSHLLFPRLKQQGKGHIINIVSTAAKRAWPNATAYHTSKWGLLGLSHALHVEGREHGIAVTALVAGGMRTPFIMDRYPDTEPHFLLEPRNVEQAIEFVLRQPAGTVIPELMVLPTRETSWP